MRKPAAIAIVTYAPWGVSDHEVQVYRSKAIGCVFGFYAPGWRQMAFKSLEAAKAKLERHPGFVRWAA